MCRVVVEVEVEVVVVAMAERDQQPRPLQNTDATPVGATPLRL
jgi:hypothetical protein